MTVERLHEIDSGPPALSDLVPAHPISKLDLTADSDIDVIFQNILYQKLCAESMIKRLRKQEKYNKQDGKPMEFVMLETEEPFMYRIALRIAIVRQLHPEKAPIPIIPIDKTAATQPYIYD